VPSVISVYCFSFSMRERPIRFHPPLQYRHVEKANIMQYNSETRYFRDCSLTLPANPITGRDLELNISEGEHRDSVLQVAIEVSLSAVCFYALRFGACGCAVFAGLCVRGCSAKASSCVTYAGRCAADKCAFACAADAV
jgi:hypothetical protein